MRKFALSLATTVAAALALTLAPGLTRPAAAQHVEDVAFPWEGPFGTWDQLQLQRGLQVFAEVCSACHGLQYVTYRELGDPQGVGLPEDQVRAFAAQHDVFDPELDDDRPAIPSDHFGRSNDEAAPDLSLMAKARAGFHGPFGTGLSQLFRGIGGPEYIHAILTGYTGQEREEAGTTLYENTAFPGGWIAMPPPLEDELVEFDPEAPNDLDSLSMDISAFLTWAAEPKMMARKHAGFTAVFFLMVLTVLLYLTNKRIWAPYKGRHAASGGEG